MGRECGACHNLIMSNVCSHVHKLTRTFRSIQSSSVHSAILLFSCLAVCGYSLRVWHDKTCLVLYQFTEHRASYDRSHHL